MGAFEKLETSTNILLEAMKKELPNWKPEETKYDANTRALRFVRGTAVICITLRCKEGEEGFAVSADWSSGYCRDDFKGFSAINAEKAIRSAVARALVIEELGRF
jgi:hypothetical protein